MLPFPYKGLYTVSLKVIFIPVKNDNFTGRKKIFYGNRERFPTKRLLAPPTNQIVIKRFRSQTQVKMPESTDTVAL